MCQLAHSPTPPNPPGTAKPTNRRLPLAMASLNWLLLAVAPALGYPVGTGLSLEKMTEQSDVIFKGTVVASGPVEDEWFAAQQSFVARETQFTLVSIIKGESTAAMIRDVRPDGTVVFRHYDLDPQGPGYNYQPQYYRFDSGKTYIVFAKTVGPTGVYRQIWKSHTLIEDQGVVRCANDNPVASEDVKEVLWTELQAMLEADDTTDAIYGINHLDQMSAGKVRFDGLMDFDRKEVLEVVRPLMFHRQPKVAQAAVTLIGSHNPYMDDRDTIHWLATIGSVEIPGIGKRDPDLQNLGGKLYWKDLVALADGKRPDGKSSDAKIPDATRALAIRALGRAGVQSSLGEPHDRWLADRAAPVRASAAILLADFPGPETPERLTALADDQSPLVRECAARAVGYAQQTDMVEVLNTLLKDKETDVRRAAAMSLLSFTPKDMAVADVLRENLADEEFAPLLLIALAREEPAKYRDDLAKAIEEKTEPRNYWGGQIPAFTAWNILFKYLQAQPADQVRAGQFDRYLDAMEKVGQYSSSEPRDIYAFYLLRGMTERAKNYREEAKKAYTFDLDQYFNQVDANPSQYQRQ